MLGLNKPSTAVQIYEFHVSKIINYALMGKLHELYQEKANKASTQALLLISITRFSGLKVVTCRNFSEFPFLS